MAVSEKRTTQVTYSSSRPSSLGWLWAVIWFFVLIFIAIPVAFIASLFFILLSPFAACCLCMKTITDFIHKGVMLPYTVAVYMVAGKAGC